jgi:hypothetical protein
MPRTPGVIDVDIDSAASLARFALASRVDGAGSRSATARRVGMTDSNFAKRLDRLSAASGEFVADVDRMLAAPDSSKASGGLAHVLGQQPFLSHQIHGRNSSSSGEYILSLRSQWGDLFPGDIATLDVPGAMFAGLRRAGPERNSSEVMVRAAALLSLLNGLRSMPSAMRLDQLAILGEAVPTTIDTLLTVASGPMGPAQAVGLAARFGEHSLPPVWDHITRSPLGFRVMRVVINLLRSAQAPSAEPWDPALRRELLSALNQLLRDLRTTARPDPYPGRTLTVAAYLAAPLTAEFAWTTDALTEIAWFGGTVRERGHSALALAQRNSPEVRRLITAFRKDKSLTGLPFIAATMEAGLFPAATVEYKAVANAIDRRRAGVRNRDDPAWLAPSVEGAARSLMMVAALSVDATKRRRACEALNAGFAGRAATEVLTDLLAERDERLMLVHQNATLSLSFLGQARACDALLAVAADRFYDGETRATALWTVGDLASLLDPAGRRGIATSVAAFAKKQSVELTRSAAYTLALMRAEPGLLQQWSRSDDVLVKNLATWGLRRISADQVVVSPLPSSP